MKTSAPNTLFWLVKREFWEHRGGFFWAPVITGGVFLLLGSVFLLEYIYPNNQHGGKFYKVCALMFPARLIAIGRSARVSWATTRIAAVYMILLCAIDWILNLFPAHPKLAPIFNPITHMVDLPFPLLLIFPAMAIDLVLRFTGNTGWSAAQVSEFEIYPAVGGSTGTGGGATLTATPGTLAFGDESTGSTSAAQSVTISNTGSAAATISSISASTPFAETNTCGSSLAAGASCTASVTYAPTATGAAPAKSSKSSKSKKEKAPSAASAPKV